MAWVLEIIPLFTASKLFFSLQPIFLSSVAYVLCFIEFFKCEKIEVFYTVKVIWIKGKAKNTLKDVSSILA